MYFFLVCFIVGVLLGVRLLFFGAERRRVREGVTPLRRSEPAFIAFIAMFGLVGYLLARGGQRPALTVTAVAAVVGVMWAAIVTRIAILTARVVPEVDPDDPRFAFQGRVAVVTVGIPADGVGQIHIADAGQSRPMGARHIQPGGIDAGEEVCIERVEDGVAYVERWSLVEERL